MEPIFETDRIRVRKFTESDLENLFALHSDPEIMQFSSRRVPESKAETAATLKRLIDIYQRTPGLGFWAAELKSMGQFIGWFAIGTLPGTSEIEIGYRLLKKYWGHGYATEGARGLLQYAFDVLDLKKIVAISDLGNLVSKRVLGKSGFIYLGEVDYQASPDDPNEVVHWFVAKR